MHITQVLDGRGVCGDCTTPVTVDVMRRRWVHDSSNSETRWCEDAPRRCHYCDTTLGVTANRAFGGRLYWLCESCHSNA